jgi:4-amino-4-deoxy-L-arabinose transferase-like glycosyltransferase
MSRLLLAAWCGLLLVYGLTAGPLYKTEGLRALVAAEMLRSGDWLVPRLCGEPLLTKPPLGYAALAAVSAPFGDVRPWTARLPSALAGCAVVWLMWRLFAAAFDRRAAGLVPAVPTAGTSPAARQAAFVVALIVPASLLWFGRAPSADLDMQQVAWVAAALVCLHRAVERDEALWHGLLTVPPAPTAGLRQSGGDLRSADVARSGDRATTSVGSRLNVWWPLALLCVAGGLLTKWTAPAFFYLTAVPFLWKRGRLRSLFAAPHLLGVALAAAVCLGWAAAVAGRVGWHALTDAVWREAATKLLPGQHPNADPWYEIFLHPLGLLAAHLPWSGLALLTLRPGFAALWSDRERRLLQLLHCWAWPSLVFWSLCPVHTPRHSVPLVPALSGLAAFVVVAWLRGALAWPLRFTTPRAALFMTLALIAAAKIAFVHVVVPGRNHDRRPDEKAAVVAALVPPDADLHVCKLKDETLLFYVGRRVVRDDDLIISSELVYAIWTDAEWRRSPATRPVEVLAHLADTQGAPLVLVRVAAGDRP